MFVLPLWRTSSSRTSCERGRKIHDLGQLETFISQTFVGPQLEHLQAEASFVMPVGAEIIKWPPRPTGDKHSSGKVSTQMINNTQPVEISRAGIYFRFS